MEPQPEASGRSEGGTCVADSPQRPSSRRKEAVVSSATVHSRTGAKRVRRLVVGYFLADPDCDHQALVDRIHRNARAFRLGPVVELFRDAVDCDPDLRARPGYRACLRFCAENSARGVFVIVPTRAHLTPEPGTFSLAGVGGELPPGTNRRLIDIRPGPLADSELAPVASPPGRAQERSRGGRPLVTSPECNVGVVCTTPTFVNRSRDERDADRPR
jgi:hypothetical protein